LAVTYGHLYVVKYLVESGANIAARNHEALRRAEESGDLDIVEYLVEMEKNPSDLD